MKPKLFYSTSNKEWVCTDSIFDLPSGGRLYYPKGIGNTPKEAWDNAFPKSLWEKISWQELRKIFKI